MRGFFGRLQRGKPKRHTPARQHRASPSPFPQGESIRWQVIRLSIAQVVSGERERVRDTFVLAFAAAKRPQNAALFSRPIVGGHELYFSPQAARIGRALIRQCGGGNCSRPPKEGTHLLVGHKGARDRLL